MAARRRTWLPELRRKLPVRSVWLTAVVGVLLVAFWPLENLSYDLGTWLQPTGSTTNAVVVYVDPETLAVLGTGGDRNELSRTNYARLLNILTQQGASWVFMDFLFDEKSEAGADNMLAQAIRRQGHVILAANWISKEVAGARIQSTVPPIDLLAQAADGRYGPAKISGNVARIISAPWLSGNGEFTNSAVWVAATNIEPQLQSEDGGRERWLNYEVKPFIDGFANCSLQDVLATNFPSGLFAGKIVFVGQKIQDGEIATMNDACGTPYSLFGAAVSPGLVVNAIELLNLVHGDWLRRVPRPWQWLAAISWSFVIVGLLHALSRKPKLVVVLFAGLAALGLCAFSLFAQWHLHWFWSWIGPVCGQTPLALVLVLRSPKPDRYVAFVSYRAEDDGAAALLIQKSLAERGLKAFIDVRSLAAGKFDEQLLREIELATFFVLILSPNSLARCANEGDWVMRELTHALAHQKKIIPVLKGGFSFETRSASIPDLPQINELGKYQGVVYSNSDFEGFMEKLTTLLTDPPNVG